MNITEVVSKRFNLRLAGRDVMDKAQIREKDLEFLRAILPYQIKSLTKKTMIGDKYVAVLLVNKFPTRIPPLRFTDLFNKPGTTVTMDLDVGSKSQAVEELEKSIDELDTRYIQNQRTSQDRNDAYERRDLEILHERLQVTAEMMSYITLRYFVYGNTEEELQKKLEAVEEDLHTQGMYGYVPEFEQLSELQSTLDSANTIRQSMPVQETLQEQFPFYFQSHKDPHGILWGVTGTNGLVLLDPFRIIGDRMSYDLLMVGKKGAGKSTLLRYLMQIYLALGEKIMAFDIEGNMGPFAKKLGGRVVRPTSSNAQINMLELRPMFSAKFDELGESTEPIDIARSNYMMEISRVIGGFHQLFPKMSELAENELIDLLNTTYRKRGITSEIPLDRFSHDDFPVMHDLLETLEDALYTLDEKGQRQYKASVSEQRRNTLETLETYLKPLCRDGAFAPIFDRKSTIDISKEDLVIFDMSLLNDMQENIYNALYYQVMVIMWAEVYKNRVINDGLPKDDLRHCICVFDESHKVLNTKNIWGLDFIEKMTRRDRKYLAALWFASQQPRDYAPSGATEHLDKIKNIFGLVQYKVLMQQDESDYDVLQNLFPQFTRSEIESTAYFQKGEQLLSLGAGAKIHCTTQVPEEYLEYFEGGL